MTLTGYLIDDFNKLTLKEKEVFGDWKYFISENDGYYSQDFQYLVFDHNGVEVVINFTLTIRGWVKSIPDTYYEPGYDISEIEAEFDVDFLTIDDCEVELTKDLKKVLVDVLKKNVNDE